MEVLSIIPILFSVNPFSGQVAMFIGISLLFGVGFTAMFYLLSYVLNHPPLNALEGTLSLLYSWGMVLHWAFLWNITCGLRSAIAILGLTRGRTSNPSTTSASRTDTIPQIKSTYLAFIFTNAYRIQRFVMFFPMLHCSICLAQGLAC